MKEYGWLKTFYGDYGIYNVGVGLPQIGSIINYTPLTTDLNSQIGTPPTFSRGTSSTYVTGVGTLGTKGTDDPLLPEFSFTQSEAVGGIGLYGSAKNWLLYSEDFTNAVWTAIGGGSAVSNTATDPFGTTLADSIIGSTAGDGKEQDSGFTSASKAVLFSCYMKTSTGTASIKLRVRDSTTSQVGETEMLLTTDYQRVEVFKKFESAAGNCFVQILVGNSSNVRGFGAMLEQRLDTAAYDTYMQEYANIYVMTAGTTAVRDGDVLTFDANEVDQVSTRGSICFWIKKAHDMTQGDDGGAYYLFSVAGEGLALFMRSKNAAYGFYIRNGLVGNSADAQCPGRNSWVHVAATWDTDIDEYKIYTDGYQTASFTTATDAFGTAALYLGMRSTLTNHYYSFARFTHYGMWNVVLTPGEVAQARDATQMIDPTLSTGKLFEVALGTSIVPTTGNKLYSFQRRSNQTYYSSTTALATVTDGVHAPASYALNASTAKAGMAFTLNRVNSLLQSEAITTTWTDAASTTITAGVGTFLGSITYGTIEGTTGDGIKQSQTDDAAGTEWVASVYVQRHTANNIDGLLTIEGDAGGTPETSTVAFTANATVQRIYLRKLFTGSATGKVRIKVTIANQLVSETMRVGGFQSEIRNGDPEFLPVLTYPTAYIKTTTAAVNGYLPVLQYESGGNINPMQGTICFWINCFHDHTATTSGNTPTLIGFPGHTTGFILRLLQGGILTFNYDPLGPSEAIIQENITYNAFVWQQISMSWNCASGDMRIYKDGVKLDTRLGSALNPFQLMKMFIGTDVLNGSTDTQEGLLDRVTIYGSQDDTLVSDNYTTYAASYGL